ncbi:MAG: DUF1415 domain-containing protein [Ferruginibacter sp.]
MPLPDDEIIIEQTKNWINTVVVGCGFCPFAAKEMKRGSVHYVVLQNATKSSALEAVVRSMQLLDTKENIETSLLIIPEGFSSFNAYLELTDMAETLLAKEKYEGIYQVASFHPQYLFAGSKADDAANYTNRSPYPMLHFLREESVSKAIDSYPNINEVPYRNIRFANEKGIDYMKNLLIMSMTNY